MEVVSELVSQLGYAGTGGAAGIIVFLGIQVFTHIVKPAWLYFMKKNEARELQEKEELAAKENRIRELEARFDEMVAAKDAKYQDLVDKFVDRFSTVTENAQRDSMTMTEVLRVTTSVLEKFQTELKGAKGPV